MAIIERPASNVALPFVDVPVTASSTFGVLKRPVSVTGWKSWVFTVDHKKIGIMYGVTAMFFFVVGGSGGLEDCIAVDMVEILSLLLLPNGGSPLPLLLLAATA